MKITTFHSVGKGMRGGFFALSYQGSNLSNRMSILGKALSPIRLSP
ncbi:hypothetical protein HMPREF1870_02156 [Bacteroidales bacterium KA00344]|nr:hypothetical protein HMPREF1870_02156 [Bacteroidales bacterium KA00344]